MPAGTRRIASVNGSKDIVINDNVFRGFRSYL